jgi:hypothetical protein
MASFRFRDARGNTWQNEARCEAGIEGQILVMEALARARRGMGTQSGRCSSS